MFIKFKAFYTPAKYLKSSWSVGEMDGIHALSLVSSLSVSTNFPFPVKTLKTFNLTNLDAFSWINFRFISENSFYNFQAYSATLKYMSEF